MRIARWLIAAAVASCALVAVDAARIDVAASPRRIDPGTADIDAWLAAAEDRVPGLRQDARRTIVWHDPQTRARTRYAVVYLHGFSASPQESAPLAQRVARALGANLHLARLQGHGQAPTAMGRVAAGEWLADAAEAYRIAERLGERVVVIGASTGATLALWLAVTPGHDALHAIALTSPYFGAADQRARFLDLPLLAQLVPLLQPTHSFEPANAAQARHWTTSYPSTALVQLAALVRHVERLPLERISVPTLVLYSPEDKVIDVGRMLSVRGRVAAATGTPNEAIIVPDVGDPSRHTLAGDILSPATTPFVADAIAAFVRRAQLPQRLTPE